jgi:hypothetical protein
MDPQIILVCDSVWKYIDQERFFGRKKVYMVRSPKVSQKTINGWDKLESVETFILHQGIKDISDNCSSELLTKNIKASLTYAESIYPNAKVIYSEMLTTSDSLLKHKVNEVNKNIAEFCEEKNFV